MPKAFSQNTREEIRTLYEKGLPIKDISELTGLNGRSVMNQISRMGIANRKKKHTESKDAPEKVCPKCHKHNPPEARFCMNCGTDIRTERELLASKMQTLFTASQFYPEDVRDECVDILRALNMYLKSDKK